MKPPRCCIRGIEDFRISVVTGRGEDVSAVTLDLPRFTLVGATTEFGLLPPPLRDRFGQVFALDLYTVEELRTIIAQSATKLGLLIDDDALTVLAERARGTPRIANRLLRRARDLAEVRQSRPGRPGRPRNDGLAAGRAVRAGDL